MHKQRGRPASSLTTSQGTGSLAVVAQVDTSLLRVRWGGHPLPIPRGPFGPRGSTSSGRPWRTGALRGRTTASTVLKGFSFIGFDLWQVGFLTTVLSSCFTHWELLGGIVANIINVDDAAEADNFG